MEHKPSCTHAERSTVIHIYAYTNLNDSLSFRYNILMLFFFYILLTVHLNIFISILCLTTDPIHQGHEKRKKSVTSARSPRNTSAQLRDRKVWEAVTSRCLGNGRSDASCKQYCGVSAWYKEFSVSASYKQYVSDECTSRQKHNMLSLLHAACLKLLVFFFKFIH